MPLAGFGGVGGTTSTATRTGRFPLVYADQLAYDSTLANLAHHYGLTVAIKNDVEQSPTSRTSTAVNEQCQQYRECGRLRRAVHRRRQGRVPVEYKLGRKVLPAGKRGSEPQRSSRT
jgi:hypothetical protein